MPRIKLTQKIIDQLTPPVTGGIVYYWDEALPSFGVRVYVSGKRSYTVRYVYKKKERFQTIGSCQVLSLQDAREMARRTMSKICMGQDPNPEPERQCITFGELATRYLERYAKVHKRSWQDDERRNRLYLVPEFGRLSLNEITKEMTVALHERIGIEEQKPVQANRVREQLSKMIKLAIETWGLLPENHPDPTRGLIDFPEEKREKWLDASQLRRLFKVLQAEPNPYVSGAVWLALLTGMRKREILDLRWDNVDLHQCYLRMQTTKNGQPHYVPLSPLACQVLANIPQKIDNDYVFCGGVPGRPIFQIQKAWDRIRKAADIEEFRFHDLRHTSAAHLVQAGVSLQVVGVLLNHDCHESTLRYAHLSSDQSRIAVDILSQRMQAILGELGDGSNQVPAL